MYAMPWDKVENTMENIKELIFNDLSLVYRNDSAGYLEACRDTSRWLMEDMDVV